MCYLRSTVTSCGNFELLLVPTNWRWCDCFCSDLWLRWLHSTIAALNQDWKALGCNQCFCGTLLKTIQLLNCPVRPDLLTPVLQHVGAVTHIMYLVLMSHFCRDSLTACCAVHHCLHQKTSWRPHSCTDGSRGSTQWLQHQWPSLSQQPTKTLWSSCLLMMFRKCF